MGKYTVPSKRRKTADYYRILGVARNSSKAAIAVAYRRLAKEHHPDKNPGDADAGERFKDIQEAFEVLHGGAVARRKKRKHFVPPKPYPGFPLTPHASGKWMKKIRGKLHYFGRWGRIIDGKMVRLPEDGWHEAKAIFDDQKEALYAGRTPRLVSDDDLTIKYLCNKFLTAKLRKRESRALSQRSFQEYRRTTDLLIREFGNDRLIDDLVADDFECLRAKIAETCGPVRLGNEITRVKSVFKYAIDNGLIDRPVRFGSEFRKPDKAMLRKHRAEGGKKLFTAAELRLILNALDGRQVSVASQAKGGKRLKVKLKADLQLRAAVLLGINAGAGNTDVANLQNKHLDLKDRWLNYPRGKTGIARRVPLWAETIAALKASIAQRPMPKDDADKDCVFLNSRRGSCSRLVVVSETSRTDYVSRAFGKVLEKLDINGRRGLNFYSLRHTFATIGLQTGDRDAVKALMGHAEGDMLSAYDETGPSDARLQAVVKHVHDWLFAKEGGAK